MLARRFLYAIAVLIFLLLGAGIVWTLFQKQLMSATFVPTVAYTAPPPAGTPDYTKPGAWLSRPGAADDPSLWMPPGQTRPAPGPAAVFFVSPTTYLDRGHWNAAYDDKAAEDRARIIDAAEASAFNGVGRVWAPLYRQATVGAFLTTKPDAQRALDLAYSDVVQAFAAFLAQVPNDAPIILAGHSQGSYHLLRLLRDHVAGRPVAKRIVAAYVVGWPVSLAADLPALGMPACTAPDQPDCVLSWESFADPADPAQLRVRYDRSTGLDGKPRRGTVPLCVNPLTGTEGGVAPASANPGSLVPDKGYTSAKLVPHLVPARCDAKGLLSIGGPPAGFGVAVLPGNNYHVFDYALFWSAIRADAARRLAAFEARQR